MITSTQRTTDAISRHVHSLAEIAAKLDDTGELTALEWGWLAGIARDLSALATVQADRLRVEAQHVGTLTEAVA